MTSKRMTSHAMQLLVSVRNPVEARLAAASGADIVDVKEPAAGPLGFAGIDTIRQIQQAVGNRVPVSAALGECLDWQEPEPTTRHVDSSFTGLRFVKLGLAQMMSRMHPDGPASTATATDESNWVARWTEIREQLIPRPTVGAARQNCAGLPDWVAVAYADHRIAGAPSVWDVLDAAARTGCSTLLIDTFCKDGTGTLSWMTEKELLRVRAETRERGLGFALAGQLREEHLSVVRTVSPDVFAVRGAVCDGMDRTATVSAARVRRLKDLLGDR